MKFIEHPGQRRMYSKLWKRYYWPQTVADAGVTVTNFTKCDRNRLQFRKPTNPMQHFPGREPLASIAIDILGPLSMAKYGILFIMVVTDRFTKLTQAVPLRLIYAFTVVRAFAEHWIFNCADYESVLYNNRSQFSSQFFRRVCQVMGIAHVFTSSHQQQTIGHTERYNPTIISMLQCYIRDHHQKDWDEFLHELTYVYITGIHSSTEVAPFGLVFSRTPMEPARTVNVEENLSNSWTTKEDWVLKMASDVARARFELKKSQIR